MLLLVLCSTLPLSLSVAHGAEVGSSPAPHSDGANAKFDNIFNAHKAHDILYQCPMQVDMPVLGTFKLSRAMDWKWDAKFRAYVATVRLQGMFSIFASVNVTTTNTTTNSSTIDNSTALNTTVTDNSSANKTLSAELSPMINGTLTLYSSVYPGPGFTGTYDWDGMLTLDPDPYAQLQALMAAAAGGGDGGNSSSSLGQRKLLGVTLIASGTPALPATVKDGNSGRVSAAAAGGGGGGDGFVLAERSSSMLQQEECMAAGDDDGLCSGALCCQNSPPVAAAAAKSVIRAAAAGGGSVPEAGGGGISVAAAAGVTSNPAADGSDGLTDGTSSSSSSSSMGTCEHVLGQLGEEHAHDPCSSSKPAITSSSNAAREGSTPEEAGITSSSSTRRVLLQAPSSTAALAPVQGRVTVREWQPAGNGSTVADPKVVDPDITVQGVQLGAPGSCPDDAPCLPWLAPEIEDTGGAVRRKKGPLVIGNTLKWVLVGVGSGLGLLLLCCCCLAMIVWRRRREKEEKERRKARKATAAAAAAAAGAGGTGGPMRYGKKGPRSHRKGEGAAVAAGAAAGAGSGGFDSWDPAASPAASSPVLPVSGSGGTEIVMESISGGSPAPYPAGPHPYAQRQHQPRKSGLLGFFGRGDTGQARGGPHKGVYEESEVPVRPPTLPGHHRGSEAGSHGQHQHQQPARTRISLLGVGPIEEGPSAGAFATALGLKGGRTQQLRQVPRSQGVTTSDSGDEGEFASAVTASATAKGTKAGKRKGSHQQQQQGAGGAGGSGDASARVGRRQPVRSPAQRDSSSMEGSESPPAAPAAAGGSRVARGLGTVWQSVTGGTSVDGGEEPSKQA